MKAIRIGEDHCRHGAGPIWWLKRAAVRLVDRATGDLLTLSSSASLRRHPSGLDTVAFIRPTLPLGAIVVGEREALLGDETLTRFEPFATLVTDDEVRINDGGCDPAGRLYVSTTRRDGGPGGGSILRVDPDGTVSTVVTGLDRPFGPVFTADRAFVVEAGSRQILVFDHDDAGLGQPTVFATFAEHEGTPNGFCVDVQGSLWVAMNGAGTVRQLDSDGDLVNMVIVPGVAQVTGCGFGGDLPTTLFITTARDGLADDAEPAAGGVFAVNRAGHGLPPLPFGPLPG